MSSGCAKPCAAKAWSRENGPDVSVNANTSDQHYEPTAERASPIREGDFLLIDIWGRLDTPTSVFYDVTSTGVIGREPSKREPLIFDTVRRARDAAIETVEQAFAQNRPIRGFEADDAARSVIRDAGFGDFFVHRTGHNLAHEIHGSGAHLDDLETHDIRRILPHTCFSVKPRHLSARIRRASEINMITAPGKAWVTGRIQQELVQIYQRWEAIPCAFTDAAVNFFVTPAPYPRYGIPPYLITNDLCGDPYLCHSPVCTSIPPNPKTED